ncbi:uncharacterized protein [Onthophagus taurus]|uniref:uncharacterized protein isoform X1 n=2 Tax=Onthophagus taurus TaxID=166361 RepID=UPI0039BE6D7D
MEALLSYFFEKFSESERNSLHARYKRQVMVEYFNTLIEGCRLGENVSSEKVVREAIREILRFHEKARRENGNVCLMGKYHDILYIAIKLCYDWELKDTQMVATLLDAIFSCEHTFERIFIGALFGTRAPFYIAGWKSDFRDQEENLRAVVYYLDHATNASLEYEYLIEKLRFIDVPIESCGKMTPLKISIQLGLPDKMLILLRYGATINKNDDDDVLMWLINKLSEFKGRYPYNFVACLQILLRVLPRSFQKDDLIEDYSELITHGVVPPTRCGLIPAELKHLCRCVIRKRLWENYELPGGIRKLPIPKILFRYLDIMED